MGFDAIRVLLETREIAYRNWKEYYNRVKDGESYLNGVRDLFDLEVRGLDWAITALERMDQHDAV